MSEAPLDAGPLVTGPWLVRLRWAAVLAQVIGVAVAVRALGLALPLVPIAVLITVLAGSNLVLGRRVSHRRPAPGVRVEWEHIQRLLADCDCNVSQAARLLGIHRRSLQRKLSNYPTAR